MNHQAKERLLGVITIGQTPRPDLSEPLARLASCCTVALRGALDGVSEADISAMVGQTARPPDNPYPLVTSLASGSRITVDESALLPLVQQRIDELDDQGAVLHLLLCAGPFEGLTSRAPLLRPFDVGVRSLREAGIEELFVVVPTVAQLQPGLEKWTRAGFRAHCRSLELKSPVVSVDEWVAKHYTEDSLQSGSPVVFDYVGYPESVLISVRARLGVPVVDLGSLAVAMTESLMRA